MIADKDGGPGNAGGAVVENRANVDVAAATRVLIGNQRIVSRRGDRGSPGKACTADVDREDAAGECRTGRIQDSRIDIVVGVRGVGLPDDDALAVRQRGDIGHEMGDRIESRHSSHQIQFGAGRDIDARRVDDRQLDILLPGDGLILPDHHRRAVGAGGDRRTPLNSGVVFRGGGAGRLRREGAVGIDELPDNIGNPVDELVLKYNEEATVGHDRDVGNVLAIVLIRREIDLYVRSDRGEVGCHDCSPIGCWRRGCRWDFQSRGPPDGRRV